MNNMKILAVEDEPAIARLIRNSLQRSGHLVDVVEDGAEAMERVEVYDYDVIILDIMLPGTDGYEICRHIRKLGLDAKIIMLTAKDDVDSKIKCLNLGADDYMTKPFSFEELEARVRALARREKLAHSVNLQTDGLILDIAKRVTKINGKPMKTSLTEFRLLEYLLRKKNKVCTRTMLQENVWGDEEHISNVMTATISKLRAKIRKMNGGKDIIQTVPKSGYIIY
jgi:DNA-binding response OmpR family regulator